jgi:hypothetical protein
MSRALERILRVRRLAEEQARLVLERETQRLRQAQSVRLRLAEQVHAQREHLTQSFVDAAHGTKAQSAETSVEASAGAGFAAANHGDSDWLLAEAALEFSSWNRMQLEQWCIQEAERVAPLAEAYQERRKELRQVERLVERQRAAERIEQDRREQAEADSWFQIETGRRERKARREDASAAHAAGIRTANDF